MKSIRAEIETLSKRLKNYRIEYPMTQKQLEEKSGVSLRCIQRFEKGEDIQLSNLIKLLNALELIDNIDMLIPDVTTRPSAYVYQTHTRQRVRVSDNNHIQRDAFKWGEDK